ncbi:MAG: helix-turn-helix domain-containing protein [Methanotrichaceae archaeon]|nr:helix-turn-helix domain-containing protein [Methanotrichaceae archaeon]
MSKPEQIPLQRHMSKEELQKRIKTLENDVKVLKRLYFIKYRYGGLTVEQASELVGVSKTVGYIWQSRWNEEGYEGLIPKYAGGRPSKLDQDQKDKLRQLLSQKHVWTTEEVRLLIEKQFSVEYTPKQIRIIVKNLGMRYAKPYTYDYRRPDNAEDILKNLTRN